MIERINRKLSVDEKKFVENEMKRAKIIALYKLGFSLDVIVKKTAIDPDIVRIVLSQM